MANEVNIYSPRYLAEVVRQTPAVHTYFRDTFFTNVKTFATERVDIDLVKGDRRMAAFVHPRVGGKVLKATPIAGDCIVEIQFDRVGVKKTMANYAPLKKVEE